jgi:hypothetical protein
MHCQIIDCIEVITKIVIYQSNRLVGLRIQSPQRNPLFTTSNGSVTARRAPDNFAIMECTSIGRIDRRVGEVLGQRRRVLAKIHDELREIARRGSQLRQVEFVLRGDVYRSLVDSFGDGKHELIAWVGTQNLKAPLSIEDHELGRLDI